MKVFIDKDFNFTVEFKASLVEAISIVKQKKTAKIIFTINYSENNKWILTYDSGNDNYRFYHHNTNISYCARNKKTMYYVLRNIFIKKYYSNISIVFYVIDSGNDEDLTDNLNSVFPDNEDIAEYVCGFYPF